MGVIALFVFIFLGMPIGVAMAAVGIIGIAAIINVEAALIRLGLSAFTSTASYLIAVIPLFLLMGEFAFVSGLTQEAYYVAHKWLGRLPGGLAMATVGGCASFAAVSGSSAATTSTMGSVALPEMRKYKYDPGFAVGSIAAGGTLGILIPPSMAFILYGIITEQSIGKLFLAGIFPGLLEIVLYFITIYILAKHNPSLGPRGPKTSWREKLTALKGFWAVAILFLLVMGGIYTGIFTPTEAAAVGAFGAFAIALGRRRLTRDNVITSFRNTLRTTGMIFIMIIGATVFSYFLATSGLTIVLADFLAGLPFSPLVILISILFLFLILGCILHAFSLLLIMVPILYPVILSLGIDPIWFGVLTVIMIEMGLITPPIGMNVFIMSGVARDVPMYTIFRGILPFFLADIIHVALLVAFPQIALFLPNIMK